MFIFFLQSACGLAFENKDYKKSLKYSVIAEKLIPKMFYGDSLGDEIEKSKIEIKEKKEMKFSWFNLQKSSAPEKISSGLCDIEGHERNENRSQNDVMNNVIRLLEARNGSKLIKMKNEKQFDICQLKKLNFSDSDFIQQDDLIFFKKIIKHNITNQTTQSKNLKNTDNKNSNFIGQKKTKLIFTLRKYSLEVIGKEGVEQGSRIVKYGDYEPVKRKEKKEINMTKKNDKKNDKMKNSQNVPQSRGKNKNKEKEKEKEKEKGRENEKQGDAVGQEKDEMKQPPQSTVLMDQACMILNSAARIRSHLSNQILKFKPTKNEKLELLREEEILQAVAGSYCVVMDPGSGLLIRNYAVDSLNSLSLIVGARNDKLDLQNFLSARGDLFFFFKKKIFDELYN